MKDQYRPRRTRNIFDPSSPKPYKLSRSKIENFLRCPRCFYVDRRQGISPPPGFPFTLNSAVDSLLKKEFDFYRAAKKPHPLMKKFKVSGVPFLHADIDKWRDSLRGGLIHHHSHTNLTITGGIDDVWIDKDGWLIVVDYKATSKLGKVTLDADWQIGYKRQMEIYQWLLRKMGYRVSDTGYFVYCNGDSSADEFDSRLNFDINLISYSGNDSWIEDCLFEIKSCLSATAAPEASPSCDQCAYLAALRELP
jgi:RecB family exonuclease